MKELFTPEDMVQLVSEHLLRASEAGAYPNYLLNVYKHRANQDLTVTQVDVVEVDSGDIQTGNLSSIPIRWWRVDRRGLVRIDAPDMTSFNNASDAGLALYPYPLLAFYVDYPHVLCKETVGPLLTLKRVLTVQSENGKMTITKERIISLVNYVDKP